MFDQLFKDSRARTRHRDGPLAEERRRYLVHCGEQQMGLKTLLTTHAPAFLRSEQ